MLETLAVHFSWTLARFAQPLLPTDPIKPPYINPTAAATAPPTTAHPTVNNAASLLVLAAAPADSVALGPMLIDELPDPLDPPAPD
jgi:hypothetical protein